MRGSSWSHQEFHAKSCSPAPCAVLARFFCLPQCHALLTVVRAALVGEVCQCKHACMLGRALGLITSFCSLACAQDAKIDKGSIADIVLVGGSTRIPRIQQMLQVWNACVALGAVECRMCMQNPLRQK